MSGYRLTSLMASDVTKLVKIHTLNNCSLCNRLNLRKKNKFVCALWLSVHMKSVVEQRLFHEFASDNKVLKTFVEFWICWKRFEVWTLWNSNLNFCHISIYGHAMQFLGNAHQPTLEYETYVTCLLTHNLWPVTLPNWLCSDCDWLCPAHDPLHFSVMAGLPWQVCHNHNPH